MVQTEKNTKKYNFFITLDDKKNLNCSTVLYTIVKTESLPNLQSPTDDVNNTGFHSKNGKSQNLQTPSAVYTIVKTESLQGLNCSTVVYTIEKNLQNLHSPTDDVNNTGFHSKNGKSPKPTISYC